MKRLHILLLILALLVAAIAIAVSSSWIPPNSRTKTTIFAVKRRILRYAHTHNHLPADLSVLPVLEGKGNSVLDGWGQPIVYEVDLQENVTLMSFGKDRASGGVNENTDTFCTFPTRDARGEWRDELEVLDCLTQKKQF